MGADVPPHPDLNPARTVPLIRETARPRPARARRGLDPLVAAPDRVTDGRYVAAPDQFEATATRALGLPRPPITGVRHP